VVHEAAVRYASSPLAAGEPNRLSTEAQALIDGPENEVLFSVASLWEVASKRG
jgi:PIN domain nuclease of toxin-antitoxin system